MYRYLNIRYDDQYSETTVTEHLKAFLKSLPELEEINEMRFGNNESFPWLNVELLRCDKDGNYSSDPSVFKSSINLIEIICSDDVPGETDQKYNGLAIKIASFLKWEVIDSSNEQIIFKK